MITSFELKNRPCCRFFYKIPYFLKNLVLLGMLSVILLLNYLVHFQKAELTVQNVYKLIAGLNSQTFNYLQSSSSIEKLTITPQIKKVNVLTTRPVDFYSNCVSRSRPCFMSAMAKAWPAYSNWAYSKGGSDYLEDLIGNTNVNVFVTADPVEM